MIFFGAVLLSACKEDPPVVEPNDAGMVVVPPDAGMMVETDAGLPPHAERCPRGSNDVVLGDANGDGTANIADVIALENFIFRGGRAPACRRASDWNDDGRIEAEDATSLNSYLAVGSQTARVLPERSCDSATFWPDGPCASLGFDLRGPERTTVSPFTAVLSIRSAQLAIAGWSTSLASNGCRIVSVKSEGTEAGEVWDDPPGVRHLGYSLTDRVEGGGVAYTILSTSEDIVFAAGAGGHDVALIQVEADLPGSGCTPCTVRFGDPLPWRGGQPVASVIVADGYAYEPEAKSVTIDVCAP